MAEKDKLLANIELQVMNIIIGLENEATVLRKREEALAKTVEEAKERSAQYR